MASRLRITVLRKIAAAAAAVGDINFRGVADVGLNLRSLLSGVFARVDGGFSITQTVGTLVSTERPAVDLVTSVSGSATASQKPAPKLSQTTVGSLGKPENDAGAKIVRTSITLVRRVGGNSQSAVGTAWTNPANAISGTNGRSDGTSATSAGGIPAATHGIDLNYLNSSGKSQVTITAATVHFYIAVTGDATGLLTHTTLRYNIGSGLVDLEVINGNCSNLTTPRSHSLPLLNTWALYDNLSTRVICVHDAASAGITATLDAIEIEITGESIVTL